MRLQPFASQELFDLPDLTLAAIGPEVEAPARRRDRLQHLQSPGPQALPFALALGAGLLFTLPALPFRLDTPGLFPEQALAVAVTFAAQVRPLPSILTRPRLCRARTETRCEAPSCTPAGQPRDTQPSRSNCATVR